MPPVTFRIQVDYVEVDAVVTDAQGNPVRGLTRDDFQVFEEGKPQKVELFAFVDVPITKPEQPLFSPTPIEPDVRVSGRFEGRLYVILLDDIHTAPGRSTLVKRAATKFVRESMGANDLAAVVHLSGRTDASQDFTSSKPLLISAVDKFMGRKLRSATLSRLDEYYRSRDLPRSGSTQRVPDPEEQERAFNARTTLESVRNVAQFLEGVRGRRKAVVLFSEGIDYDIYDVFNNREATTVMDSVRDAIGAATRSNVVLYTVDPRGLTTLGDESIEAGAFPDDPAFELSSTGFNDELRRSQDSLRVLAEETGGFAAVNSNDFTGAFARIVRENSSYYVLGYYPPNDRRDGRFRKIEVKVNRPGVEVRARKGYVAPKGKAAARPTEATAGTSPELREALSSPVPEGDLTMAVTVAPFKGEAPKQSVLVTTLVDGQRFRFTEKDGTFVDLLELSLMAVDARGKIQGGDRQNIELKLRPQTRQAVEAAGFRVLSRLSLAPGRYQLRVGARAVASGAIGSVFYDLEVPDFSKEPFSMSGLVVSSNFAVMTPTARADEQLKDVLKTPPTAARAFSTADTLWVFTEVYDNQVSTPHQVDIRTTLRANDGRIVFKTEEQRSSDELQGSRGGGYGYLAQIPLADVAGDQYVLRVEAQSRLSGSKPVVREALVRVVAPQQRPATPPAAAPGKVVVNVARGPQSEVTTFGTRIARNDAEFQALWSGLPMRRPAPRVSFGSTMIVAVFLGSKPTAGYGVEIVDVKRDGETLIVQYTVREPAAGVASADVVTTPYAIAGVPQHAGEVRFDKVDVPAK